MLKCEGYMMYQGRMTVTPGPHAKISGPYQLHGTFLYKPEHDCWYCNGDPQYPWGTSVPAELCSDFVEVM